jgi:multidrug efflux pump subunit AcrA (membrane-fusion protein)
MKTPPSPENIQHSTSNIQRPMDVRAGGALKFLGICLDGVNGRIIPFLLAASFAIALTGCSKSGGDADDKPAGEADKAAAEAKPGVTVDADTQTRIGLKIETPAPAQWQPETKVYGQVLDPAPLTDLAMDLRRAEIALDSSNVELERARQLKGGNNISAKAYHDAETTYAQNLADAQAARFKIQTAWGRKIADMLGPVEVPAGTERAQDRFLDGLRDGTALVRVDLPPGERMENQGQTARIVSLAEGAQPVTATCFDLLPVLDPQTQEQGILFSAGQPADKRLMPGEAVTVYVRMPGEVVGGVVVPDSAVLRHEGKGWVYVQTDTNQFLRVEMPLDRQTDGGWFVSENLSATNHIVVTGAQTVLSAELSGGGFTTGERD